MATVRELIAKFGFDIDTKPLEQFNDEFGKTKKAIAGFAVTKLLGAFSAVGQEFDMIRRNIGLFANDLEALGIVNGMDRIVSSTVDASRAVQQQLEALGDIEFTKKIVQDAEDFAAITGKSIEEITGLISEAAAGQTLAPLQALGLTTQKEIEALARQNIQMTTATIKTLILNRLAETRVKRQKDLARATKDLDVQQGRFSKIMEDFGLLVGKFINPILSTLLELFNDIAEFFVNSRIGQFVAIVGSLAAGIFVLASAFSLLSAAVGLLSFAFSPFILLAAGISALIAGLIVVVHDFWAAFADPESSWFFNFTEEAKAVIDTLKEIGEWFDKITSSATLGGKINAALGSAEDVNKMDQGKAFNFYDTQAAAGQTEKAAGKTANITIHADTVEAGQAAGKEVGSQLKTAGFSDKEITFNQIRARVSTQAGG